LSKIELALVVLSMGTLTAILFFFANEFSLGQIQLLAHLESSDRGHSELVWSRSWFAEFHNLHPDIEFEYEAIGSAAGR
jgi:hypothetical protein